MILNKENEIKIMKDEVNKFDKQLKEEIIKNKKLEDAIKNIENENKKLKDESNKSNLLKVELDNLINENKKLKEDLLKANKIIYNLGNNNGNNNELKNLKDENMNLKYQLVLKDNEIKDLKLKLLENNNSINKNKFDMILYFLSTDQVINHVPIRCSYNDTFAEVEEKLYKKYNNFRDTNNTPICNGKPILRFKTLNENKIKDEDVVQLIKLE